MLDFLHWGDLQSVHIYIYMYTYVSNAGFASVCYLDGEGVLKRSMGDGEGVNPLVGIGIISLMGRLEGCELGKGVWINWGGKRGMSLCKLKLFLPSMELCVTGWIGMCADQGEKWGQQCLFLSWLELRVSGNVESIPLFAKASLETYLCCNFSKAL